MRECDDVSPVGGQAHMDAVPKTGDGEEGREGADKAKAARSSKDNFGCPAAVPTLPLVLLPCQSLAVSLAKDPVSLPNLSSCR